MTDILITDTQSILTKDILAVGILTFQDQKSLEIQGVKSGNRHDFVRERCGPGYY